MTDYTNFFPSKEYTNPSASNYNTNNSVNTETALNTAMNGKFTPSSVGTLASEKAWSMRCGGQNGGGHTLTFNSNGLGGGNSSVMRYTKSCEPVYGDNMSGGGCGCGSVKVVSSQNGGSMQIVSTLGNMLAPLGTNELASVIVLLFLNHYSKEKVFSMKKQKGGNFNSYVQMLTPLGKENLVVLASLLLLNYFAQKKKTKTSKKQKGGSDVLTFLDQLLAPLGVNAFGTAWLLIILNEISNKKKSKKQSGGSDIHSTNQTFKINETKLQKGGNTLMKLVTPNGLNSFASLVVLVALNQYLHKNKKKSQKGGEIDNLLNLINSYKKSNLNNIKMNGGAKKSTPKRTMKKSTPKKTMKKSTPKKTMKKSTPKKTMKKTTPKKTMKKTTPKKTMKKTTPKKKSMKKTTPKKTMKKTTPKKKSSKRKSTKKTSSKKSTQGLLSFLGL
jgi:hypothetical protein